MLFVNFLKSNTASELKSSVTVCLYECPLERRLELLTSLPNEADKYLSGTHPCQGSLCGLILHPCYLASVS
jgi:hypothetical protein